MPSNKHNNQRSTIFYFWNQGVYSLSITTIKYNIVILWFFPTISMLALLEFWASQRGHNNNETSTDIRSSLLKKDGVSWDKILKQVLFPVSLRTYSTLFWVFWSWGFETKDHRERKLVLKTWWFILIAQIWKKNL